jgi:Glycosyltransferase family 10 (fucosyltransferase) C-term/Fucosyltransferase, N-terminal
MQDIVKRENWRRGLTLQVESFSAEVCTQSGPFQVSSERVRILIYQEPWGSPLEAPSCDCCEIWRDRTRWEAADAVVFHLPQLSESRFPPYKQNGQVWVALCGESAVHYPMLARRAELGAVFDVWMSYQRDADVWCPYFGPAELADLRSSPREKIEPSPAAAFVSSAYDRSGRAALLTELTRHLPVDSYGRIGRNRVLQDDDGRRAKRNALSRYRFTIAFENAIDRDYVTEKFFDPLCAGSVPVYLGAPNIEEFAPADNCFINAASYGSPRALADHLIALAADADAYARYLRWKSEPLRPSFLEMIAKVKSPTLCRLSRVVRERRGGSP